MGSGASSQQSRSKRIYLEHAGNKHSIVITPQCTVQELKDLIITAIGLNKRCTFTLKDNLGSHIPISSSMPQNTQSTPYHLEELQTMGGTVNDNDLIVTDVLTKVSEEFSKVFKVQEFTEDFSSRLIALEKKMGEGGNEIENSHSESSTAKLSPYLSVRHAMKRGSMSGVKLPKYPQIKLSSEDIEALKKPSFNIWNWKPDEMMCLIEHMFHELDLVTALKIEPVTLQQWLLAVQHKYRNNPFHNFRHCFCVTQMMYGMIHLLKLANIFNKLELATLITACICHDIDHPGFNNNYQINARTELAIRYNDISPLENHHCAVTFELLSKPEYNIYSQLSKEDYKLLRAGIIDLILATDMSRHSEIMESFKKNASCLDYNNEEHRKAVKLILIKSCDISNEVRPAEVAEPWVDCLLEEYFRQSDIEKSSGLPVAPFMDRDKVTKPSAQIGFIKFVLIPMFESLVKVYPQLDTPMLKPLKGSLEHYEHLKLLEEAKI